MEKPNETATVKRATARLQSVELLRSLILSGKVAAGDRLNEVELAAQFGTSRGPIRESLQTLAAEGLVVIRSHKGSFVKTFSKEELDSLYKVRVVLERYASGQAADWRTSGEVEKLGVLLDLTRQRLATEGVFLYENDFHLQVLAMTHNEVLVNLGQQVLAQMALARLRSANSQARSERALTEHTAIYRAIEKKDTGRAIELMEKHLAASYDSVMRTFEAMLDNTDRPDRTI